MELFNMSVLISIVQLVETVQHVPVLCNICQYCLFLPELNACFCCLNVCCCFSAASTTDSHCPTTLLIRNKYSFIEHHCARRPRQGGRASRVTVTVTGSSGNLYPFASLGSLSYTRYMTSLSFQ